MGEAKPFFSKRLVWFLLAAIGLIIVARALTLHFAGE